MHNFHDKGKKAGFPLNITHQIILMLLFKQVLLEYYSIIQNRKEHFYEPSNSKQTDVQGV